MTPIVTVPHPVLRKVARPVETVDKRLTEIIADMTSALISARDPEGVGLAAPQIGLPLRLFLIRPDMDKPPQLFVNPEIIKYSQRQQIPDSKKGVFEGCLSIPNHYSPVKRSMSVTVNYQSIENDQLVPKTETFSGFAAHIIQHEMDHLNGVLFIDHTLSQNSKLYLIKGEIWEEVEL